MLDAHDLGWGASTRNGGMVLPELKAGPRALERTHGELGLRLHAEVEAAFDHVERVIADGSIDCAYERSGQLYLSHGERSSAHLDALAGRADVDRLRRRTWCEETSCEPRSARRCSRPASWWSAAAGSTRPGSTPASLGSPTRRAPRSTPHTPATSVALRAAADGG